MVNVLAFSPQIVILLQRAKAKNLSYFIAKGKDKELCLFYIPLVLDLNARQKQNKDCLFCP